MKTGQEKIDLSIVVIARNEEANLQACLESCDFAREIILVDDGSLDRTVEIAENFGAKVFHRALNDDWGSQKTFAISKATSNWLFLIDCDERVSENLRKSIIDKVQKGDLFSYEVKRHNKFHHFKIEHGPLKADWVPRLIPNDGVFFKGRVHEQLVLKHPIRRLSGELIHFTYSSMDQYYSKMNKYAELSAKKYYETNKKFNFFLDVLMRPFWAAFKVYIINKGFLDGKIGVVFAINHYGYTAQKYIRYWVLQKTKGGHL